ncbi:MAG: alanyl-tRNA editing protein [Acidobacteriota bacterium]
MSQIHAFERDPYLCELATEVAAVGEEAGAFWAVLADTILYPEGGGQPADRGSIAGVAVVDVRRAGAEIRHLLAAPVEKGPAQVRLDWGRRFDHMQQHTGQHLLSALAEDRFGWPTTAFHLGPELSDVELDTARIAPTALTELEETTNAEIRAARPVTISRVPAAVLPTRAVRTRGLPPGHAGDVRLVEITGIDVNTCGGTHLRSTAEIEALKLLHTEPMRGGTRVYFVAGARVRRRLAAHEERSAALRGLLGAPDAELAPLVALRLDEIRQLERRLRAVDDELAGAIAASLASAGAAAAEAHLEGHDLGFLQRVARAFTAQAPAKVAFLTATAGADSTFLLAAGEQVAIDFQALGKQLATLLGGRGGGSGRVFQGKAGALTRRGEAVALVRAALSDPE